MKLKLFTAAVIVTILSCKKDKDNSSPSVLNLQGGVFIANEGNFQSANSSVSYYNPDTKYNIQDVYKQVNGHSPGDICQSMQMINGKLYIVVNNSGKIEVCDPLTMKNTTTVNGLTSPRYILGVNTDKAYVTDLSSNAVSVIRLTDNAITNTIPLNGWTEQMLHSGNKVYVTNISTEFLYVINDSTDQITDSIHITKGGSFISQDMNGKIWLLCGGDYLGTYTGMLYRINPANNSVEQTFSFPATDFPTDICMNRSGDSLYYLNTSVYKMSITAASLPASSFIASNGNSFYTIGTDINRNQLYVADAIDFIQKGRVYRFDAGGNAIDNFLAGIAPGEFLFY
jgi:DNA-binding beta-propeller fold protein YncE